MQKNQTNIHTTHGPEMQTPKQVIACINSLVIPAQNVVGNQCLPGSDLQTPQHRYPDRFDIYQEFHSPPSSCIKHNNCM